MLKNLSNSKKLPKVLLVTLVASVWEEHKYHFWPYQYMCHRGVMAMVLTWCAEGPGLKSRENHNFFFAFFFAFYRLTVTSKILQPFCGLFLVGKDVEKMVKVNFYKFFAKKKIWCIILIKAQKKILHIILTKKLINAHKKIWGRTKAREWRGWCGLRGLPIKDP